MFLDNDIISTALIKQLDAAYLRQKVIADNIANMNTPGFKKSEVRFENALKQALGSDSSGLRTTHPRHIPNQADISRLAPEIVKIDNTSMRASGNNVDIDQEMVNLAKNTLVYSTVAQTLSTRKSIMSYVVQGGK